MSQHDYNIANASGASVRADINALADAIASSNSGAAAPSVTFPHQWWMDESTNILKHRNSANTAWINIGIKDANGFRPYYNGAELISSYVRATTITTNTVFPASATKVTFITEESDAGGNYASGTYTAPATGVYDIRSTALLPSQGAEVNFQTLLAVYVNGTIKAQGAQFSTDGSRAVNVATLIPLTAGNTVEIYITHAHSSSVTVGASDAVASRWYFEAVRVG